MSCSFKLISLPSVPDLLEQVLLSPRMCGRSCGLRRAGFEETARNVAVNPDSFGVRCLQELNESTPAAHVLSPVCAYFPNLDMGSELQAPRVYVKLAWLSPLRSSHLAAAQHGDAPCHWGYRLQTGSCLKPEPMGLAGAKGALVHLTCPGHASCPHREHRREEEVLRWPLACIWKMSCARLALSSWSG